MLCLQPKSRSGSEPLFPEPFEPLVTRPENDDPADRQQLFTLLYEELRTLAQRELRRRGPTLTLGATTLLHEVYIHLQKREGLTFPDRARFFSYASRAMRGLIIDYARSKQALKRGSAFEITSLPTDVPEQTVDGSELQRLSDAIELLAETEPRLAQVVDLKYFSGFSLIDIAEMWGVSERTVQRHWEKARLFLHRHLAAAGE
jgi:RNA polymerase sigma factor (TIGR02999 family)